MVFVRTTSPSLAVACRAVGAAEECEWAGAGPSLDWTVSALLPPFCASPTTGIMPPATSVDVAAAATGGAEDEVPQCPLCLEDLDATDLSVRACQCGYPVRLFIRSLRAERGGSFCQ